MILYRFVLWFFMVLHVSSWFFLFIPGSLLFFIVFLSFKWFSTVWVLLFFFLRMLTMLPGPDFSWFFVVLHVLHGSFFILCGSLWFVMDLHVTSDSSMDSALWFLFIFYFFLHGFHGFPLSGSSFMIWFFVVLVVLCRKILLHARLQNILAWRKLLCSRRYSSLWFVPVEILPVHNSRIVWYSPRTIGTVLACLFYSSLILQVDIPGESYPMSMALLENFLYVGDRYGKPQNFVCLL